MKLKLHWQILIGMVAGALMGFVLHEAGFSDFVSGYVRPIGTLFIRLISMIAVPLVLASLIVGASSIKDIKKLSRIGGKTIFIYILTTSLSISIGLLIANFLKPGVGLDSQVKEQLRSQYSESVDSKISASDINFTEQLIEIVPVNPFNSLSTPRGEMLQVVFFALFVGVVLTCCANERSIP